MVTNNLNAIFGALADPTRRAIVARLGHGPATVRELAAPFAVSRPAISKHLRVLERAGVTARTRRGRESVCALDGRRLWDAVEWLEQYRRFWEERLEHLGRHLERHPTPPKPSKES